ncbi:hypothetical protein ABLV89_03680 [Staphylococcus equorum]
MVLPEDIVDQMEYWLPKSVVADGFNLMPPVFPDSLEGFVALIVARITRKFIQNNL